MNTLFKKIQQFDFKKHWKWFLIPLGISILISTTIVAISYIKTAKISRNFEFNEKFKIKTENIFPELNVLDYYPYVEYVDNKLVLGDKLIAAVISDLIARLNSSKGDLEFAYDKISSTKIIFYINWIDTEGNKVEKNFGLELN